MANVERPIPLTNWTRQGGRPFAVVGKGQGGRPDGAVGVDGAGLDGLGVGGALAVGGRGADEEDDLTGPRLARPAGRLTVRTVPRLTCAGRSTNWTPEGAPLSSVRGRRASRTRTPSGAEEAGAEARRPSIPAVSIGIDQSDSDASNTRAPSRTANPTRRRYGPRGGNTVSGSNPPGPTRPRLTSSVDAGRRVVDLDVDHEPRAGGRRVVGAEAEGGLEVEPGGRRVAARGERRPEDQGTLAGVDVDVKRPLLAAEVVRASGRRRGASTGCRRPGRRLGRSPRWGARRGPGCARGARPVRPGRGGRAGGRRRLRVTVRRFFSPPGPVGWNCDCGHADVFGRRGDIDPDQPPREDAVGTVGVDHGHVRAGPSARGVRARASAARAGGRVAAGASPGFRKSTCSAFPGATTTAPPGRSGRRGRRPSARRATLRGRDVGLNT